MTTVELKKLQRLLRDTKLYVTHFCRGKNHTVNDIEVTDHGSLYVYNNDECIVSGQRIKDASVKDYSFYYLKQVSFEDIN